MGAAVVMGAFFLALIILMVVAEFTMLADARRRQGNVRRHREARQNLRGKYLHAHPGGLMSWERVIHLGDVNAIRLSRNPAHG